jgi:hypothetical protein
LALPPPATPSGPWPLVPKHLCCAVVDTKGRYDTPRKYAQAVAFDMRHDSDVPQLQFLGDGITPCLLVMASSGCPSTIREAGRECGLPTFVLARAIDRREDRANQSTEWVLDQGEDGRPPLQAFRQELVAAAARWEQRHRNPSEQAVGADPARRGVAQA